MSGTLVPFLCKMYLQCKHRHLDMRVKRLLYLRLSGEVTSCLVNPESLAAKAEIHVCCGRALSSACVSPLLDAQALLVRLQQALLPGPGSTR